MIDLVVFTERMFTGLMLGTMIGVERQFRQCITGLRTNALVCLGSSLFVLACGFEETLMNQQARVISYIVSGIGFVGAGVIVKDGAKVRGLNTAVTLWCTASIGVLCGIGQTLPAMIGTSFILGANIILKKISKRINVYVLYKQSQRQSPVIESATSNREASESALLEEPDDDEEFSYQLSVVCRKREEGQIRRLIMSLLNGVPLILRSIHTDSGSEREINRVEIYADLIAYSPQQSQLEQIVSRISIERGVISVSWRMQSTHEEN